MKCIWTWMTALQHRWQGKVWQKRQAPNLLFPVRNEETSNTVWYETTLTTYGLFVTIHRQKPHLHPRQEVSRQTAMAGVHIDYFISSEETTAGQEQINVQLYDESVGPYEDAHWEIPASYHSTPFQDASRILVQDAQSWHPRKKRA